MKKIIIYFLIISVSFFINTNIGQSAEDSVNLFIIPDYITYLNPDSLSLNIVANNNEKIFNTIEIKIKFSPERLTIDSLDYENSFCDIILDENIDNESGIFHISCGNPNPILATTTNIIKINFNKITPGWAEISINDSSILADNELGTNITGRTEAHNLYIYK